MPEPATAGGILGVKYASLIAGFAGGVVSLSFMKNLTKGHAVLAVFTGSVMAGYATPIISHHFNLGLEVQNGAAFILGLTAMNIIPGILFLSRRFQDDPFWILDVLRNKGGNGK